MGIFEHTIDRSLHHDGTGTVRNRPPLPTKSTMTQWPSLVHTGSRPRKWPQDFGVPTPEKSDLGSGIIEANVLYHSLFESASPQWVLSALVR